MAKRQRRPVDQGKFQDPLSNYDDAAQDDPFATGLADHQMDKVETNPFYKVLPTTPVGDVVQSMADADIGCVLVTSDESHILGIFTQRDLLNKVVDQFEQVKDQPIADMMTKDPSVIAETDSPATAINLMAVGGYRHIPVVDVNNKVVGLVGPRRTTAYLQQFFPLDR
jgi:CBS domain-containing protein